MKSKVYTNKPCTILQIQAEVERVVVDIQQQMCEKVVSNFEERINACRLSTGGHMADVVFRT